MAIALVLGSLPYTPFPSLLTSSAPDDRYDAFTHKQTAQYSLAYEKASIIFNISAVLSCHAADQNRAEDAGLKTAYHSFQASAGMFVYINENFLHAPSTDLNRETVKTLINITLAQAQEVFLEKQVVDEKKPPTSQVKQQAKYLFSFNPFVCGCLINMYRSIAMNIIEYVEM